MYLAGVDTTVPVSLQTLTPQNITPQFPDIVAASLGPNDGAGNGMRIANLEGGGWYVPVPATATQWITDHPVIDAIILIGAYLLLFKGKK
jgi:hypothetical protein